MKERDIRMLVKKGILNNELEYERALSADRALRLLTKDDPSLRELRKELRDLVSRYEALRWSDERKVTKDQLKESDVAEEIAERERRFIQRRKEMILSKLKKLGLKQKDLGALLNHNKSYTSELLNGIRAFSLGDLILIHRLLKIDLDDLFLTTIPLEIQKRIKASVTKISFKKLKLREKDLELVPA